MDHLAAPVYTLGIPRPLRWLGARDRDGRVFRMRWGEVALGRRGWACELCLFDSHYSFHVRAAFAQAFVRLPMLNRWHREPREMMEAWGASCDDGALHLHWGHRTKVWFLPWRRWDLASHDVRRADESWAPYVGSWERHKAPDGRHVEQHTYRYMLRDGTVQEVIASVHVERHVWRHRVLRFRRRVRHSISVEFSNEIGERTGSWKGGTIGCSYDLRPDETPRECLRRMERDRKFE